MKKTTLFFLVFSGVAALPALAQKDTLRSKDGNREYIQVMNGTHLESEGYFENGLAEGTWTAYHSSKYPSEITEYHKGKKDGIHMVLKADGGFEYVEHYKNDKLNGTKRIYNYRGPLAEEVMYTDGKKSGQYIKWSKAALKQEEGAYLDDERHGKTIWYYEDGNKPATEYNYVKGSLEGEAIAYHLNGKVSEKGMYKNNNKTGEWKEYYDNGKVKAEGKYENDLKEGVWKQYTEDGKAAGTIKYSKGEVKK